MTDLSPQDRTSLVAELYGDPSTQRMLLGWIKDGAKGVISEVELCGREQQNQKTPFKKRCEEVFKLHQLIKPIEEVSPNDDPIEYELSRVQNMVTLDVSERIAGRIAELNFSTNRLVKLALLSDATTELVSDLKANVDRSDLEPIELSSPLASFPVMWKMPRVLDRATKKHVLSGIDLMKHLLRESAGTDHPLGTGNLRKQLKQFLGGNILVPPPKTGISLTTVRVCDSFRIPVEAAVADWKLSPEILQNLPAARNYKSQNLVDNDVMHFMLSEIEQGLAAQGKTTLRDGRQAVIALGENPAEADGQLALILHGHAYREGTHSGLKSTAVRLSQAANCDPEFAFREFKERTPEEVVAEAKRRRQNRPTPLANLERPSQQVVASNSLS